MSARRIPTRPGLLRRVVRAVRVRWLRRQADVIRAERRQYEAAGACGPVYVLHSVVAELDLRIKARRIELSN